MQFVTPNEFELLAIPELMGKNFFIPDYQRGYRWEKSHIFQLLSDIWDFTNSKTGSFYCLQPIVVKECSRKTIEKYNLKGYENEKWYEVIDGQQRLTTIRLIIQLYNLLTPLSGVSNCFNLFYETRPELTDIFQNLTIDKSLSGLEVTVNKDNIDSYYITSGLNYILEWFTTPGNTYEKRADIHQFPMFFSVFFGKKSSEGNHQGKSTQVIWYNVYQDQSSSSEDEEKRRADPKAIFNRLNNSKIPLLNSELVKALFLSRDSVFKADYTGSKLNEEDEQINIKIEKAKKQNHIAKKWELLEHALGDTKLWSFITNRKMEDYSSKIELLFDFISKKYSPDKTDKELNKKDNLFTFLYFDRAVRKGEDLWDLWLEIEQCFETIQHWYEDREMYHKIGYLVCVEGDKIIIDLLNQALTKPKSEFKKDLNNRISSTIKFDFNNLNYLSNYDDIQRILLLYNIETVRKLEGSANYPFDLHKEKSWTLEHIHAQNSDLLSRDDQMSWRVWLEEHKETFSFLSNADYVTDEDRDEIKQILVSLEKTLKIIKLDFSTFLTEFNRVINYFEKLDKKNGRGQKVHALSNMALLGGIENSKINNSIFETKRRYVLKMDAEGNYIPLCTKYVFLKYYNIMENRYSNQQIYYWSETDRENYLLHISKTLKEYCDEAQLAPLNETITKKESIHEQQEIQFLEITSKE